MVNIRRMLPQDKMTVLGQKFLLSFLQGIDKRLPKYLREKHVLFVLLRCSFIPITSLASTSAQIS